MRITRTGGGRGRRAAAVTTTVLTASALLLTGCSSDGDSDSLGLQREHHPQAGGLRAVRLQGSRAVREYHKLHPNITVKEETSTKEQDYYPKLLQQLNAGSGLGTSPASRSAASRRSSTTQADKFVDLSKTIKVADWVAWKEKQATTDDGKVIGVGTDIGPMAICYRKDLFQKAGLPTDREAVAKAVAGDWEDTSSSARSSRRRRPRAPTSRTPPAACSTRSSAPPRSSTTTRRQADLQGQRLREEGWDLAAEAAQKELTPGLAAVRPTPGRRRSQGHQSPPWPARLDGRPDLRQLR